MKQGRRGIARVLLTGLMGLAMIVTGHDATAAARRTTHDSPNASAAKARGNGARQFTGWVTAYDASSLTVEKRGKQPRTMVFSKQSDTRTTGDVAKEARVTVYYREADGHYTAQRVVVKQSGARAAAGKRRGAADATARAEH